MHLPASLKALKFVAQGLTFSNAKQMVKDRRLAKSLAVPGLDQALLSARPKQVAKALDAWDEKLSAQVAFYKEQGLTQLNPSLASKSYIQACRKLGLDPVWDSPPKNFNTRLTFVPHEPPLHLTKEQIFNRPNAAEGSVSDTFSNAQPLPRNTVGRKDVSAGAEAMARPKTKKEVRFADEVPSCPTIFRGGLTFAENAPDTLDLLAARLSKKEGKKADR